MARIRTIKPKFWDDIKIGRLPRDARLLFIGLWTFADDLGVVIADPLWLKAKIFPYDQIQLQQLEAWLKVLEKTGFISHLTAGSESFYYLPTFSRHQLINKPNFEDVNIRKDLLDSLLSEITDQSRNDHGSITDRSGPIVVEDKEKDIVPPIIPRAGDGDCAGSDSDLSSDAAKKKSCGKRKKTLDLSAVEPSFQPIVADWLAYKSERGQTYQQRGFAAFYEKLQELSGGSADAAWQIVRQSMANNWAGIFALKNKQHDESRTPTSRGFTGDLSLDDFDRATRERVARRLASDQAQPLGTDGGGPAEPF